MTTNPYILALDDLTLKKALALTKKLGPKVYAVKVHSLFDEQGPGIVTKLKRAGAKKIWLDLKLHDIPHTVGLRARALKIHGADILSVHASGGLEALREAVKRGPREIYAVTVLTSLEENDIYNIYHVSPKQQVLAMAKLAKQAGVRGIVCSPLELKFLQEQTNLKSLKFITPGIRLRASNSDQTRVATPHDALAKGATHIVLGREITTAKNHFQAFINIQLHVKNG